MGRGAGMAKRQMGVKAQRGVALIEVLIAFLILAIGLVGFSALQVRAVKATQSSLQRNDAAMLANFIMESMRANKAATVKIAAEVTDKDEEITAKVYDELMPMFSDDGRFDAKALTLLSRSLVELDILKAEPDMSKLYTEDFLPK